MKTLAIFLTILLINVSELPIFNQIDAIENSQTETNFNTSEIKPVRITFYPNTTQSQKNEAISIINPVNHFMCVNDSNVYVVYMEIDETGRGSGSAGNGDSDNVINGIPSIQSHRIGSTCD